MRPFGFGCCSDVEVMITGRPCPAARSSAGWCTMTSRIRHLSPADYPLVISVIDNWWGGRQMAGLLPRLFFEHFTDTSFDANADGIPVSSGYDGPGSDRVRAAHPAIGQPGTRRTVSSEPPWI
jgi:hypothetical protein